MMTALKMLWLRTSEPPFLRHLRVSNNGEDSNDSTEIALALQNGSAPLLESLTLSFVMESSSMPILADAVAKDGRFAGLHQLDLVGEKDKFDVSPLLQAITTGH